MYNVLMVQEMFQRKEISNKNNKMTNNVPIVLLNNINNIPN